MDALLGLVHVGDELREVNGNLIIHKRPEEISQILVCARFILTFTEAESFLIRPFLI